MTSGDRGQGATHVLFSPVTRLSGLLSVDVLVDGDTVVDAEVSGTMFRGFEWIMQGRDVTDAIYMTERICGICSSAHGAAASYLLDDLFANEVPEQGQLLRNIMMGADFLQNHLRHFYVYSLPDFVRFPERPPFLNQALDDARLPPGDESALVEHYFAAISQSQKCHQVLALFGGKAPHQHSFVHGGVTVGPTAQAINEALALLDDVSRFIEGCLVPDSSLIAAAYGDYYRVGITPLRMISYGLFPTDSRNAGRVWRPGVMRGDALTAVDTAMIREEIAHSWFVAERAGEPAPGSEAGVPDQAAQGVVPDPHKPEGYSWVKTVRYGGEAFECGPLARMLINGLYHGGTSTMDRIQARTLETRLIAGLVREWLDRLVPGAPPLAQAPNPVLGEAWGLTDSMRGALLHHAVTDGRIARSYDIVTPSAWNFSPKGMDGLPGPAEAALTGTRIPDGAGVETVLGRVIRSFDPCLSCATHVFMPDGTRYAGKVI